MLRKIRSALHRIRFDIWYTWRKFAAQRFNLKWVEDNPMKGKDTDGYTAQVSHLHDIRVTVIDWEPHSQP